MKFGSIPRVKLANLPTPIQEMPNLTKLYGGPRLWIKRDDLTGLAFGGNKARKLEYLMADVLAKGCDYVVSHAGFHSNWCTQVAAACRKLGLGIVLVKTASVEDWEPNEWDSNHLLHKLMGAEIEITTSEKVKSKVDAQMVRLSGEGYKPYYMPLGGSVALGAMGYVNAVLEIINQSQEMGVHFDYLVHCTGSGGTQAGIAMGNKLFSSETKIISVADDSSSPEIHKAKAWPIINEAKNTLGLEVNIVDEDLNVYNEFGGGGYGYISEEKIHAVKTLAEKEGIFIDPVYTAPAMAQMIALIKRNKFQKSDNILFLHSGGSVALFGYREPFKAVLEGDKLPWIIPKWSTNSK